MAYCKDMDFSGIKAYVFPGLIVQENYRTFWYMTRYEDGKIWWLIKILDDALAIPYKGKWVTRGKCLSSV